MTSRAGGFVATRRGTRMHKREAGVGSTLDQGVAVMIFNGRR